MLVESIVGWLVQGVVGEADRPNQAALMLLVKACQQDCESTPEEMLKRIFDIDGLGGEKTQDDKDPAEEQFKIFRDNGGGPILRHIAVEGRPSSPSDLRRSCFRSAEIPTPTNEKMPKAA